MKYALLLAVMFTSLAFSSEDCKTTSSAETAEDALNINTDVPNHLKGAKIIIRLADGKESEVPAEKYKVVPRKQQFIVTKTKQTDLVECKNVDKNRVSVLGGQGPKPGLDKEATSKKVTVESKTGLVGGLQYQRKLGDTFSVGGQLQTNESVLLGIGVDF